jgi:hypothetical protein
MPTLPYPNSADVKVFSNEYINVNTMNRALLRLFYNDEYLSNLSSLNPVDLPTVSNMVLVSTGPGTYTWKTDTEVKSLLNITDSMFGLADVDDNASNMLDGYGLFWDATKDAFIGKRGVSDLNDLADCQVSAPEDLQTLFYSTEYGSFINGLPSDFTIGYIQHVTLEVDTKVQLPEVSSVGKQIVITKIGDIDVYVVPNAANAINGQSAKSLLSNIASEETSTIHLRSVIREDDSIEWITVGGDGTFDFVDTSLVPGSSIDIRNITDQDLMLAPYDVTVSGVPDATDTVKGIVRLATSAEAIAGTATDIAVTPWGVKYWFDNYAIPFADDATFDTGTATDEVASVKQIQDRNQEIIDTYSPAYYQVYVCNEQNLTTPADFDTGTYVTDFEEYSRGSIRTGNNNLVYPSTNSIRYSMNIEVLADSTTLQFHVHAVDDNLYIYIDGVLKNSSTNYSNTTTPNDLSFTLNTGTYLLQIVKNDSAGGSNTIDMSAIVIQENVRFVNPY